MIKNLLSFKIKKNIKKIFLIFFGVMLGPYKKSRGTRGTGMSANAAPSSQWRHIMYNKGKQFENQFFIYEPKCKKNCIFWAI